MEKLLDCCVQQQTREKSLTKKKISSKIKNDYKVKETLSENVIYLIIKYQRIDLKCKINEISNENAKKSKINNSNVEKSNARSREDKVNINKCCKNERNRQKILKYRQTSTFISKEKDAHPRLAHNGGRKGQEGPTGRPNYHQKLKKN